MPQKVAAPIGKRQAIVRQQQRLVNELEAEKRDKAYAQKALVGARESEGLIVDPISGETFRELSVVLDVTTWVVAVNTPNTPTVVATLVVPNGIVYYFRAVKSDVDRNAPYLYGTLQDVAPAALVGTVRVRVFDASGNQLKGQPWTGSVAELTSAAAAPSNWFTRVFFNSRVPVRAQMGDQLLIELNATAAIVWANSALIIHTILLTKQA